MKQSRCNTSSHAAGAEGAEEEEVEGDWKDQLIARLLQLPPDGFERLALGMPPQSAAPLMRFPPLVAAVACLLVRCTAELSRTSVPSYKLVFSR